MGAYICFSKCKINVRQLLIKIFSASVVMFSTITAFYISHRMSSSVFCDKILVMDAGRVADFAEHEELMKKEGSLYRRLFEAQAQNYA